MSRPKRKPVLGILADKAAPKQLEAFCIKPGQSGNPKGRPKGARNRLGTQFLEALEADLSVRTSGHRTREGEEARGLRARGG